MNKLTLIWDPLYGDAVPDGKVDWKIDSLLYYLQFRPMTYNFGNASFLGAVRRKVSEGVLDYNSVVVVVNGRSYHPNDCVSLNS